MRDYNNLEYLYHRLDGPAVIFPDGSGRYYVNGVEYKTYLEYLIAVEEYKLTNKSHDN